MTDSTILELASVSIRFGALAVVSDLSFAIESRSITSLIGPNGAGKSTIFNLITGFAVPSNGDIRYRGRSLVGMAPHQINRLGIARAFQISLPFANLTVRENVKVAALYGRQGPRAVDRVIDEALDQCGLARLADRPAGELTVGGLRRLELARAVATRPSLLMADEPLAGLVPAESMEILTTLRSLRDGGMTIFLVEHDMRSVMAISDTVVVIDAGRKIAEGKPADVVRNPQVIEAYLGAEEADEILA